MAGCTRDRGQYSMVDATYQESECGWRQMTLWWTQCIKSHNVAEAVLKEPGCGWR